MPSNTEATSVIELNGDSADVEANENPETRSFVILRDWILKRLAVRVAEFRSQHPDVPMIALGDLNLTPWSPLFRDFETSTELTRAGRGYGLAPTWYAIAETFAMGLVLDHCLISDGLECVSHRVGADFGSDHRAVIVGLKSRK